MNPRSRHRTHQLLAYVGPRDGWRCSHGDHCLYPGEPCDPNAHWLDHRAATLEHVLPPGVTLRQWIDLGHNPFDPAHAAVSHRRCNLLAGAKLGYQRSRRRPQSNLIVW